MGGNTILTGLVVVVEGIEGGVEGIEGGVLGAEDAEDEVAFIE